MTASTNKAQRWRPPKPLVGQRVLEKVLNRHTAVSCPESRLFVAVISAAIVDCLSPGKRLRRKARRFVLGDDLGLWCEWIGLNPDFVRFVARKAGYLADEQHAEGGHAQAAVQTQQPADPPKNRRSLRMNPTSVSIPCALGRLAPQSPASSDELRAMRAAAWHKQGIVVVPLEDIHDEWARAFLSGIATQLYGARTATTKRSRPWSEGEVIDRGDGETWTVVATTGQSVTLQRSRDGALATLGQLGEGRP